MMFFFNYRVLVLNIFYNRSSKKTYATFIKGNITINANSVHLNKKIITKFKNLLKKQLKIKKNFSIFLKTNSGSDFHYSTNLNKFIKKNNITKNLLKNIYIVGMSSIEKNCFFPTFEMMVSTYSKTIKCLRKT